MSAPVDETNYYYIIFMYAKNDHLKASITQRLIEPIKIKNAVYVKHANKVIHIELQDMQKRIKVIRTLRDQHKKPSKNN